MQVDQVDENDEQDEQPVQSENSEDYLVIKEDCINHVQKRVSSRLKDIRAKYSHMVTRQIPMTTTRQVASKSSTKHRTLLSDGKPYSGSTGRMTKEIEQKLTTLYGNAIREASNQSKGNLSR